MMLIRLTCFSRNRLDCFAGPMHERIEEILATSLAHNRRDAITGALVYDDKWFAQVLEGSEHAVSTTFERILRDPRHSDVALVTMTPVAERMFGASPMAGVGRNEGNRDLFRHYGESERFDPQLMRADRLSDLITAVVDRSLDPSPRATSTAA
jgi:hypothetical protein